MRGELGDDGNYSSFTTSGSSVFHRDDNKKRRRTPSLNDTNVYSALNDNATILLTNPTTLLTHLVLVTLRSCPSTDHRWRHLARHLCIDRMATPSPTCAELARPSPGL